MDTIDLMDKINKENPINVFQCKLNIEPLPYARPRKGRSGNFYNPRDKYKKTLIKAIKSYIDANCYKDLPCNGPVDLDIVIGLNPPETIKKSKTKMELTKLKFIRPQVRPDLDNYIKPILDALNSYLYKDDGQICSIKSEKVYTNEEPFIDIIAHYRQDKIKLR
jgi:Holliday junction resolvase RusA-like endonuclease